MDGQIIARAKPTKRHQRLAMVLGNLLASHVQPRGCDVLPLTTLALSDASDDERARDLMVTCDSADLSDDEVRKVRRPPLVIEILSERTAADDLGIKLLEYQAIPWVQEYLVIDSRKRWAAIISAATSSSHRSSTRSISMRRTTACASSHSVPARLQFASSCQRRRTIPAPALILSIGAAVRRVG